MVLMKRYLEYIKENQESDKEMVKFNGLIRWLNEGFKSDKVYMGINDPTSYGSSIGEPEFTFYDENHRFMCKFDLRKWRFIIYNDINDSTLIETINNDFNREMVSPMIDVIAKFIIKQHIFKGFMDKTYDQNFFNGDVVYWIQRLVKKTYDYQKDVIEKGELNKLKDVKINDKILDEYPEMKDIKKQTEWS